MPSKEATIGNYYDKESKKRTAQTDARTALRCVPGMQCAGCAGQNDPRTLRPQTVGSGHHSPQDQSSGGRRTGQSGKTRTQAAGHSGRAVPASCQRTDTDQGCAGRRGTRTVLAKKKDGLGLKGPLTGHFTREVKSVVVAAIKNAVDCGLSQKQACTIFGIVPRKFRRWARPAILRVRTAWNRTLEHERTAIESAAWRPELFDKPLSHKFVHGHESGEYFVSFSTVYRVLKAKNLVKPFEPKKRTAPYVSAHKLLDEGFSLLCYDGTEFVTDIGVTVHAIPVMILPQRYLLHVGHSLTGVNAGDLMKAVTDALAMLPQHLYARLIAHSDRGSAMKAKTTQKTVKELLGAPVHFGRPHTPDDQAWIESFIKTLKYHRDVPQSFKLVDDVVKWITRFADIYNNDPHSSLDYVTPLQTLSGQKEVILNQRKQNLAAARLMRYTAWKANRCHAPAESILQPV